MPAYTKELTTVSKKCKRFFLASYLYFGFGIMLKKKKRRKANVCLLISSSFVSFVILFISLCFPIFNSIPYRYKMCMHTENDEENEEVEGIFICTEKVLFKEKFLTLNFVYIYKYRCMLSILSMFSDYLSNMCMVPNVQIVE